MNKEKEWPGTAGEPPAETVPPGKAVQATWKIKTKTTIHNQTLTLQGKYYNQ